ncbi:MULTISPECIES: ethanolamine ammonia-lyase subunit EutB [Protofrankia]|uniref:Ethanolamine ammonia-lyase n=1 Tax=Candidatus Protofrankia datiscae TaxID=2716812 RepID=F8AX34_9ACTN|nr:MULTISPECIES: ethanolamine ammonia-lyase subunit EutB [Protofrankia]AEH11655.1 Ethanolamine ammonia-lyase [Candidatus Protofrankia datiscae]
MGFHSVVHGERYVFADLVELLARAGEEKSGDRMAGLAAYSAAERLAAKQALADVRLSEIVATPLIDDAVTDLIVGVHDAECFGPLSSLTVGEFRDLVLRPDFPVRWHSGLAGGITPEVAAAVARIMSDRELVIAAKPLRTVTRCRSTMGETGVFGVHVRLNHPLDDLEGILLPALDGLMSGRGDAVLEVDTSMESAAQVERALRGLGSLVRQLEVPTQTCVLGRLVTQLAAMEAGAPLDLLFSRLGGTESANRAFGVDLGLLDAGRRAVLEHHRDRAGDFVGDQVTYFAVGQGSAFPLEAHHGLDQLTISARAYGVARAFDPFLVNSVVGFGGVDHLSDSRQVIRAGLEDHFVGKLLGLPMGCDVFCAGRADDGRNTGDDLLMLLAAAGCNHAAGVPPGHPVPRQATGPGQVAGRGVTGIDDAIGVRDLFGLRPAPEFAAWLADRGLSSGHGLPEPAGSPRRAGRLGAPPERWLVDPVKPMAAFLEDGLDWARLS